MRWLGPGPENKYRVLVVEDTPEFLEAAKAAFGRQMRLVGWDFSFASSYEEAMERLGTEEFTAVITDLFLPSQIDWRDELLLNLEQKGFGEGRDRSRGMPSENPSGLAIAQWCHTVGLPYVMVSQGDRNEGDFGLVRDHIIGKAFLDGPWDPLSHVMVDTGSQIDKKDPTTWLRAMIHILQNETERW